MFADNNQISWRQLLCQMVLGMLGAVILFLPGKGKIQGIEGCVAGLIAVLILVVYCIWLVRIAPAYGHLDRHVGRAGMRVAGAVFLVYFILTGAFLVSLIWEITSNYMISGASQILVHAIVILGCSMAGIPEIQRRGRMAEFCFPFFIGALVLMMILAFSQHRGDFGTYLMQTSDIDVDTLMKDAYAILCAFACIGAAPFLLGNVKGRRYVGLSGAVVVIFLFFTGMLLLLQGSYGMAQIEARQWPALSVMASIRIPGGFVSRMDPIWVALLMLFLLFGVGSTFFYSNYIVKRTELGVPWYVVYGLVYVVSLIRIGDVEIGDFYLDTVKFFFAPAIFLWNVFLGIKSRRRGL